jgi:hypothetical protein
MCHVVYPHLALVLAGCPLLCCAGAKVAAQAGVPAATSAVGAQLADGAGRASVACSKQLTVQVEWLAAIARLMKAGMLSKTFVLGDST